MCVGRETDPLEDRIRLIRAQNEQIRKRQLEIEADKLQYAWQSLSPSCYISSNHHQFTTFDVKYIIIKPCQSARSFVKNFFSLSKSKFVHFFYLEPINSYYFVFLPFIIIFFPFSLLDFFFAHPLISWNLFFFWNHCVCCCLLPSVFLWTRTSSSKKYNSIKCLLPPVNNKTFCVSFLPFVDCFCHNDLFDFKWNLIKHIIVLNDDHLCVFILLLLRWDY